LNVEEVLDLVQKEHKKPTVKYEMLLMLFQKFVSGKKIKTIYKKTFRVDLKAFYDDMLYNETELVRNNIVKKRGIILWNRQICSLNWWSY